MNFRGLLGALRDQEKAVRIAALRALMRLPLDAPTASEIRPHRAEYERCDLSWSTWVPDDKALSRIVTLVEDSRAHERELAEEIAASAKSETTRRFAGLALDEYDPRSEDLLAEAQAVAETVAGQGSRFQADVSGLFSVYLVFLRPAVEFWFHWVANFPDRYDPAREVPSWFPMYEGALAVCRQIEWVVSRAPIADVLDALDSSLNNGNSRVRFAAAQLIEWAVRTASQPGPWRFGGGSAPPDVLITDFELAGKLEYKQFDPVDLPMAIVSHWSVGEAPLPPQSTERRISFWISEGELRTAAPCTGSFRVGKEAGGNLIRGTEGIIADSDIPSGGLSTSWTVVPTNVRLESLKDPVKVNPAGISTFDLLIPRSGDSETISLRLTPVTEDAKLQVIICIGSKLYRELLVSLYVTGRIVDDNPLTRAIDVNLRTTHEWTTPEGELTLHVYKPGKALIFGYSRQQTFPPGQEVDMGTAPAQLNELVNSLHAAAESLRAHWTDYFNDIDPNDILARLGNFQPQWWDHLNYLADASHEGSWQKVATSAELQDVAFYGRSLYDTLFPPQSDSRKLIDDLSPGQLIHIVWRPDSEAGWIPQLPWALLYMGDVGAHTSIDGALFWGHRFRIQHTAYKVSVSESAALGRPTDAYCSNALFFGDSKKEPATEAAKWQRDYWIGLGQRSLSYIAPDAGSPSAKAQVLRVLTQPLRIELKAPPPVAVVYFFCHYGDANGSPILRFGLTGDPDDTVRIPELGRTAMASRPLVFANACATAGSDVYTANSITKTFFDRGCRAFIGTDCMVPAIMASRLAIVFFQFLLRIADKDGKPMAAGEALAQTRLFLWCQYRNIGGLLYSYLNNYGLYMADETEISALRR